MMTINSVFNFMIGQWGGESVMNNEKHMGSAVLLHVGEYVQLLETSGDAGVIYPTFSSEKNLFTFK